MAEDTSTYIDAEFTGKEAANIEVSMIGGERLRGAPYVLGNNSTNRRVKIHPDDFDRLERTGLVRRARITEATEEQQQQDADNSATVDFLQRAGVNQDTAVKLEQAGYTTPDAIRVASDDDLKSAGVDKRQVKKLRQNIGSK